MATAPQIAPLRNSNIRALITIKKTLLALFVLMLVLLALAAIPALGQTTAGDIKNGPDQTHRGNARVNPTTLGMEFSLPLGNLPGRAGNSIPISLNYSSKVWRTWLVHMPAANGEPAYWASESEFDPNSSAGWTSSLQPPWIEGSGIAPAANWNSSYSIIYRLTIHKADGSTVDVFKNGGATATVAYHTMPDYSGTYYSLDGSNVKVEYLGYNSENTIYLPDGTRYFVTLDTSGYRSADVVDANGNRSSYSYNSTSSKYEWKDTLSRVAANPLSYGTGAGDVTYSIPSFNGGSMSYTLKYKELEDSFTDSGSTVQALTDLFVNNTDVSSVHNPVVLNEVDLPDGTSYKFTYNEYGEIDKIVYPTGAYERFNYAPIPPSTYNAGGLRSFMQNQGNRGVIDRYISDDNTSGELHWQYSVPRTSTGASLYSTPPYRAETIAPDGSKTVKYLFILPAPGTGAYIPSAMAGREYEERSYDANGTLVHRRLTKYQYIDTYANLVNGTPAPNSLMGRVERVTDITIEGSDALAQSQTFEYDTYSNVTRKTTYDSTVPSLTTAQTATAITSFSLGTALRTEETTYVTDSDYISHRLLGLPAQAIVRTGDYTGSVVAKTEFSYDESSYALSSSGTMPTAASASWVDPTDSGQWGSTVGSKRGNPTSIKSYFDIANTGSITTHTFYDQFGNVRKVRDGRGNDTETLYDDDYAFAYPTTTISAIPDSTGTYGSSSAFTTSGTYDYNTGLPLTMTDANSETTTISYADPTTSVLDPFLRVRKVTAPNGQQTINEYGAMTSASTRWTKVKSQLDSTNWTEAYSWMDGLGRAIKSQRVDDAGDVFALTCYDSMGRVAKASNPFRNISSPSCSSTSLEWTSNTFDDAGRPWKVTTPDSAVVETTYGLATSGSPIGSTITVADQAGKLRRSVTNALGQLSRVDEPDGSNALGSVSSPNQPTTYGYDGNGKLVKVTQGSQNRYFMYDAIGRMLRVFQPEQTANSSLNTSGNPDNNSWTAGFTYDDVGNVLTTTDAKGTTITNTYDALNRPKTRTYSDSTPTVTNYYDGTGLSSVPSYSKSELTRVTSSVSDTRYEAFDSMGRLTQTSQVTGGTTYTTGYTYNLSGAVTQVTYPSGRTVSTSYDSGGELSQITGVPYGGSSKTYANNFSYTPDNKIKQLQLGNGLWETAQFNSRSQVTEFDLGTTQGGYDVWKAAYDFGELQSGGTVDATKNSGNIAKQTVSFSGLSNPFVQSYTYDTLDRLTEAKETVNGTQTWIQDWAYDRYGNRSSFSKNILGSSSSALASVDSGTNRFSSSQGFTYDSNGNVVNDPTTGGRTFTFNGDNKITEVKDSGNNTIGTYYYDGEGKRVKKVTASETTTFVYSNGELLEERNSSGTLTTSYVYAGSQLLATETATDTNYTATDHLGSPRVITNSSGSVVARRDFLPFGEEIFADGTYRKNSDNYTTSGTDAVRQRFTGYQRDTETGLDFAEARTYDSSIGRFTAVDPLMASGKSADPQTFNRYAYALNNPELLVDSTGLQSGRRVYVGNVGDRLNYTLRRTRPEGYRPVTSERRVNADDGFTYRVTPRSMIAVGKWDQAVATPSQGISTAVTPGAKSDGEKLVDELGARAPGAMHMIGALSAAGFVAGAAAVPAVAAGGAIFAGAVVGEALLAEQGIRQNAEGAMIASIESDRRAGVREAWRLEAENVRNGGDGTYPWTPEQRQELIETGRVKDFDGHHINSVHDNPELARNPKNVEFKNANGEHLAEHGGNWRNPTRGPLIKR